MSVLVRNRQDAATKDYFDDLYKQFGGIPMNHQMAIDLRMNYFTKYVLDRKVNEYKTPIEKDWMYIAKREYWYDVNVRAGCDAAAAGATASMARMFMLKRFIWWPIAPVALFVYVYRTRQLYAFHSRKFFDMCNVGEQYEVGYARNVVLRRCNQLLDVEDF